MNGQIDDVEFKIFYMSSRNAVVGTICEIVHDSFVAEDLAHDLFVRIYRSKQNMDYKDEGMKKYLYRAAKNISIDYMKKKKRCEVMEEKVRYRYQCLKSERKYEVESICLKHELSSVVNEVIDEFPEEKRKIFREKFLKRKKLCELAKEFNISYYTIKKIDVEIKNKLRERLIAFSDCELK